MRPTEMARAVGMARVSRLALACLALVLLLGPPARTAASGELVLAVTWLPAFCEIRPKKPECRSQATAQFDTHHFTLHGLWPQPRSKTYCDVAADDKRADKAGRWEALPALDLGTETRAALDQVMPGTQSFLHRHQWLKHGTCYGDTAEVYLRDAMLLMNQLNGSAVPALFVESIGGALSANQIRDRFTTVFGVGAGQRVKLVCKQDGGRRLIVELRINLQGSVAEVSDLGALMAAAPPAEPGCDAGLIDPPGLQ